MKFARFALLLTLVCLTPAGALRAGGWKAGTAKVNITPREPILLSGYPDRKKPADGIVNALWAKALVLEDADGRRAVVISLDLIGIPRDFSQAVCADLAKKYGFERPQILIACSHTHSGPVVGRSLRAMLYNVIDPPQQERIDRYLAGLGQQIVDVVGQAAKAVEPSTLAWGQGTATFAVNRRNNPEPEVPKLRAAGKLKGPVDHDVPVLAVRSVVGRLTAVVFGYACHATSLGGFQWSSDYPGFAQTELEKIHPGCTALFVAGCGGDQNPLPRSTIELSQGYGHELAAATEAVIAKDMAELPPRLETSYREVDLPLSAVPTREQVERDTTNGNQWVANRAHLLLEQLDSTGKLPSSYPYPVQVWRLGPLVLVALGGEVVVDYSLRLKQELGTESGDQKIWIAAYANDVMAYIPSRRVLDEGGYEGAMSMLYYGLPSTWAPEIEELIVRTVHAQVPVSTKKK